MSVSSTINRNDYTGNGAVDTYAYGFRIFANTELRVTVRNTTTDVETTLTLSTDYTVTGVGEVSGGNVVLVNSSQAWLDGDGDLSSDYTLTIRRVLALKQETDIRNQGDFYPETHEDQFDRSVMISQQQQDEINRSVKLPESIQSSEFDGELPAGIVGAVSKCPITNTDGDGWAAASDWPTASAINGAAASAAAASASETAAAASEAAAAASAAAAAASAAAAAASDAASALNLDGTTRASPRSIVAGTGVTFTAGMRRAKLYIVGDGGAVDISASPYQVQAGTINGQELLLVGRSDTNTVKFDDGDGLSLNGPCFLGANQCLKLNWDGTDWVEEYRSV